MQKVFPSSELFCALRSTCSAIRIPHPRIAIVVHHISVHIVEPCKPDSADARTRSPRSVRSSLALRMLRSLQTVRTFWRLPEGWRPVLGHGAGAIAVGADSTGPDRLRERLKDAGLIGVVKGCVLQAAT